MCCAVEGCPHSRPDPRQDLWLYEHRRRRRRGRSRSRCSRGDLRRIPAAGNRRRRTRRRAQRAAIRIGHRRRAGESRASALVDEVLALGCALHFSRRTGKRPSSVPQSRAAATSRRCISCAGTTYTAAMAEAMAARYPDADLLFDSRAGELYGGTGTSFDWPAGSAGDRSPAARDRQRWARAR